MPHPRDTLALLTRAELLDALDRYQLHVPDRRVREDIIEALARSRAAPSTEEILVALSRDRLKEICRQQGLEDWGREKDLLASRIVAGPQAATPPSPARRSAEGQAEGEVFDALKREELLDALDEAGLTVPDRRVREDIIAALIGSAAVRLDDILERLSRDRLKEICRGFGLDPGGREKELLIGRIVAFAAAGPEADEDEAEADERPPARSGDDRSADAPPPRRGSGRPRRPPLPDPAAPGSRVAAAGIISNSRPRGSSMPHDDRSPAPASPAPRGRGARGRSNGDSSANLGFEAKLWLAADKLRNNMDAAEYKHVVLGLIFLKYISDTFEEHRAKLMAGEGEFAGANPEDRDEYQASNVFWVPKEGRWSHLQANAKQPTIGKTVDDAMVALERDNPRLKGVLPKDYARPGLDKHRLGELIDLVGTIGLGDRENRARDILGRVYEYFLTQFASAEGKNGGQFYTPNCVVRCLVEMLAPYKGRIYDPCCGSGGMFVQSEKFVEAHGGKLGDISIYGQESNPTTRRLAVMNLALRGIEADFGPEHADTFRRDLHPDLRADYVLANPPFNDSDWFRKDDDVRWQFGVPPKGNANFAWVQHFIHHLAPNGMTGFVLANGSMSSNQSGEGEIRRAIVEADLVDCMVAMPGQLFYSTQIPVCLWFLTKNKNDGKRRNRRKQTLFIDARKMGTLIDRVHRELTDDDLAKIAGTYHAWRGDAGAGKYEDIAGFCRSATTDEIAAHGHVLTPGRYVGAEEVEEDGEPFEAKMRRLVAELEGQFAESAKLERQIRANLKGLGYGG